HALHHFFIVPHKSLGNLQQRFAHGFHGGFNFPRRGLFDTLKLLAHSGACVIRRPFHMPVQGIRRLTDRPAYLRHHRLGLLSYPLHHSAVGLIEGVGRASKSIHQRGIGLLHFLRDFSHLFLHVLTVFTHTLDDFPRA